MVAYSVGDHGGEHFSTAALVDRSGIRDTVKSALPGLSA